MPSTDDFLDDVGQHAYGWPESLRFTYDTVRQLVAADVPGAFVECGVGAGVHPAAVCRALQDAGGHRTIRCFDSFQGVPNGGAHDVEWNQHYGDGTGTLTATGAAMHSLADVQANLIRRGCTSAMFEFYVGWFQDIVPPVAEEWARAVAGGSDPGIAFLRLDGDLYESTKVCLEHLYPLVVPGGVLVVDDLNLDGCWRACEEFFGANVMTRFAPITASGDGWMTKP